MTSANSSRVQDSLGEDRAFLLFEVRVMEIWMNPGLQQAAPDSVSAVKDLLPTRTALYPNFPNPFNNTTALTFDLPENARVSLIIYTVTGQEVARVVDGPMPAGKHTVKFNAQTLPSGLYLARLQTGKQVHTRRILLLK